MHITPQGGAEASASLASP